MTVQWQQLERITKDIEEGKPRIIAHLHHSPKDNLVVQMVPDKRVRPGKVFLGSFNTYNQLEDNSYKTKCENLEKKVESLTSEIWCLRNKMEKIGDILL